MNLLLLTWYHTATDVSLVDDAPDFLHPTFKQGVGYTNFVRQQSHKSGQQVQHASFIAHFDTEDTCLAELQANGKLEIKGATEVLLVVIRVLRIFFFSFPFFFGVESFLP
jgi:hypothetical protein